MNATGLTPEQIKQLEDKVLETYLKAESIFSRAFPLASVSFKDMGRTAGRARYIDNSIKYSPTLYKENESVFIARTVPHEIAHLITHLVFPHAKQAHGPEWRSVMQKLGVTDNSRCHSYDTSSTKRSRDRFVYRCDCEISHWITAHKHKKMQIGIKFTCRKCKKTIDFTGRVLRY